MRPTHALPLKAQTTTADPARKRLPPKRARRRVINPSLWSATHLDESVFTDGAVDAVEGVWEWHEENEEEDVIADEERQDDTVIVGAWRRMVDGEVVQEQVVRGPRRRVEGDIEDFDEEDFDEDGTADEADSGPELFEPRGVARRSASPLFSTRTTGATAAVRDDEERSRSGSPLFASRPGQARTTTGDALAADAAEAAIEAPSSPLFPVHDATREGQLVEEAESADVAEGVTSAEETAPNGSAVSSAKANTSPLLASRKRPSSQGRPAAKKTNDSIAVPDPLRKQVLAERSRDLDLLGSFFGGDVEATSPPKPNFGGFAESDGEDEEDWSVLRLRGGGPDGADSDEEMSEDDDDDSESSSSSSSPASSSSSSSSSSGSGSSSDSDGSDSDLDDEMADAPIKSAGKAATAVPLKDMFGSSSAGASGGFSLMANLDPDLELDELDVPLAPSLRPDNADELAPLEVLQPGASVAGLFDPDPNIPLFFPTQSTFAGDAAAGGGAAARKGKDAYAEAMEQEGWRGFWRAEGETDETMKEIWNRDRGNLTTEWKKRYREARKHRRRRGGADEVE